MDVQQYCWFVVGLCGELVVFYVVDYVGYVGQVYWCVVFVVDDGVFVLCGIDQLIVGVDGVILCFVVECVFGCVDVGLVECVVYIFQGEVEVGQLCWVYLYVYGWVYVVGD